MSSNNIWVLPVLVFGAIFLLIVLCVKAASRPPKCPKCGQRTTERVDSKYDYEFKTTARRTVGEVKNKNGEVIRTIEKDVPVIETHWIDTWKCSSCGGTWTKDRFSTKDV